MSIDHLFLSQYHSLSHNLFYFTLRFMQLLQSRCSLISCSLSQISMKILNLNCTGHCYALLKNGRKNVMKRADIQARSSGYLSFCPKGNDLTAITMSLCSNSQSSLQGKLCSWTISIVKYTLLDFKTEEERHCLQHGAHLNNKY